MASDPFTIWVFALKLTLNACVLLAVGLAAATASGVIAADDRTRWLAPARGLAGLITLLVGARVALAAVQLNGGLEGAFTRDLLGMVWRFQEASAATLILGASLTVSPRRFLAGMGALVLAASYGLGGHTQALEAPGPAPFVAAGHALIAGLWIAAPLVLWPRAGVSDGVLAARVDRFGAVARWLVPFLFVAGGWLAWRLTGGIEGLLGSAYGRLLLVKLGAAGLALALGAANAFVVARAVREDPARGRRRLRLTLGLDAALFAVAIAMISAATSFVGPPGPG